MTDYEINDSPFTFSDDSAPLNNEPLEFSGSVGFSDTLTNLTGHDNDFLSTDGVDLVWATFAASNGLTYDDDNYSLTFGGTLTGNTSITGATYDMAWTDIGAFDISSNSSDIDVSGTLEIGRAFLAAKRSIKFNTSAIEITDLDAGLGLQYSSDYSTAGTANDRWLPDYAAVKSYTDNKFTFENGLTDTADTITLGGALTAHTTIDGATNTYNFSFSNLNNFNLAFDGSATITDSNITQVGLVYAGDYTGTFTTRSLVDKGYVDDKFTFSGGLTDTADTITLGGTLTSNTTIDGSTGTYDFNLSNLDQFTLGFDNNAVITDSNVTPLGLQYAGDYTGSFVARSLVDKAYVDSVSGAGSIAHNDTTSIQGGSATERYHLTDAQHTIATQTATSARNGYLTSTDWSTFNGKFEATISSIADEDILQYNTTSSDWENTTLASAGILTTSTQQFEFTSFGLTRNAGLVATFQAGEALVAGDVCYIGSTGSLRKAAASAVGSTPAICIVLESIGSGSYGSALLQGFYYSSTHGYTDALYLSGTAGALTDTAPSTSGYIVQVVGHTLGTDLLYFNPSMDVIVLE